MPDQIVITEKGQPGQGSSLAQCRAPAYSRLDNASLEQTIRVLTFAAKAREAETAPKYFE
jgi:hypothetical protein